MSLQTNSNKLRANSGFTIVELLIVIVVIAILAAITIVAYNGITARANTSSALASAQSVAKKIELYNAEENTYPTIVGVGNATTPGLQFSTEKSYYVPAGTIVTTAFTGKPTSPANVFLTKCGTGTNQAVITGYKVQYWQYDGTAGLKNIPAGIITGTVGGATVSCAADTVAVSA
jgi:prepilin-type N-terminal cleavage/methylation domain-containing protein